MQLSKVNPVWFLKVYLFLNLYKPLIGLVSGREIITAFSIVISLALFFLFLAIDVASTRIRKKKLLSFCILLIFSIHLIYSMVVLRSADVYPSLVSFFQSSTPMLFLFVLESLDDEMIRNLTRYLLMCLWPFVIFGFIEFLLPIGLRTQIYMSYSRLVTGESNIDVAYYLGDTEYGGLRLGSLFFEPLTFAFVSTFLTIYLFSRKQKAGYVTLIVNILSLGKLPIATTLISLGSNILRRIYRWYYVFVTIIIALMLIYFMKNAEEIAVQNPSLGSHMLGLAYGLINSLESPLAGHGFGTAGYVSYVYYQKINKDGPFIEGFGGLMNGNESAVGSIAYQLGFILLLLFLSFFVVYFLRLVKAKQIMMASVVLGYLLSLFLSESVLSITVISVFLIFSKAQTIDSQNGYSSNH